MQITGHSQSHIQTQLGQVEPDDVPDLVIILDLMELNEFHLRSLWNRPIWHHALQAVTMKGAHSLEPYSLVLVPFHSGLGCIGTWYVRPRGGSRY